ncbi:right-handed parallel beta-helix repeat-containing protein [Streptomyces sp. NPDC057617]|uniref:right-handed parallel beta-helix repeat-containing protein n=1 Tax=Streptomyces sp. NPDC057617 TaxID=3346184 RepID=UPI0036A5CB8C
MHRPAAVALALTCLMAGGTLTAVPAGAAAGTVTAGTVTVYVDPSAPAGGNGLRRTNAVRTFGEAEKLLRSTRAVDATILTPGGTYYPDKEIKWTYDPPGGRFTFAAVPGTGEVVMDGSRAKAGYYMTISSPNSSFTVSGKTIKNYTNGGIRVRGMKGPGRVTIKNNLFQHLGNKSNPGGPGYGAVHVTDSARLTITGNRFYNLENTEGPGEIHGVYLATRTSSTVIRGNRFGYITGDPVRTRNGSNNNTVDGNKFWRSGSYAVFSDWRPQDKEVCGKGNVFKNNQVGRVTYFGKKFGSDTYGAHKVPVRLLLWGHHKPTAANVGGCATRPITNGGGNKYVTTRPW